MQERVLDLGQNLAEELEHLLPHAGGVLRGRVEVRSREGAVSLRTLPSSTAREDTFSASLLLSLWELAPSALPVPFPLRFSP